VPKSSAKRNQGGLGACPQVSPSFSRKRSSKRLFCFAEDNGHPKPSAKRDHGGLGACPQVSLFFPEKEAEGVCFGLIFKGKVVNAVVWQLGLKSCE
jgi:hypothetical protein